MKDFYFFIENQDHLKNLKKKWMSNGQPLKRLVKLPILNIKIISNIFIIIIKAGIVFKEISQKSDIARNKIFSGVKSNKFDYCILI